MDGIAVVARFLLAAVFAVSGIAKLLDREGTRRAVESFGLPASLIAPMTSFLPVAECAVSLALVPGTTARAGACAALGLLVAFMVGISINLAQGRRPDCNCFGRVHAAPIGPSTLVRNVTLAAAAGVVAFGAGADAGGSVIEAIEDLDGTGAAITIVVVVAVAVAFLALGRRSKTIIAGTQAPSDDALRAGPAVGSEAPAFTLSGSSWATVALADLLALGKRVLLVFLSPSCGSCARIAPELGRWQRELSDRLTVAVMSSGTPERVRASASRHDIVEVLVDEHGTVAKSYGSRGTPGAVLIDVNGAVAAEYVWGGAAINDLLIGALGLTEVVAAFTAEREASAEAAHDHDERDDDERDHSATERPAAPAPDLREPESIDRTFVPLAREDVSMAEHEGESVLVDRATGAMHLLNPTAAIVWRCLDGTGTVDDIAIDIADVFQRDTRETFDAVLEVVRRFGRQGLLAGVGISPEETASAQATS